MSIPTFHVINKGKLSRGILVHEVIDVLIEEKNMDPQEAMELALKICDKILSYLGK
jgi:hypothetical protein